MIQIFPFQPLPGWHLCFRQLKELKEGKKAQAVGLRKLFYNDPAKRLDNLARRKMRVFVRMDHVGIAVKNLDDAVHVYRDILGFKLHAVHVLAERKVKVALISTGGETQIELLEPLDNDSTIAKFLESHGEGIHHFAVQVEDIQDTLAELKRKGATLIDEKPKDGAEGKKIAFVHPKSTKGVLLELVMQ